MLYQVQHSKPPSALLENVSNLASIEYCGVSCLQLICRGFERIGYHIVVQEINARWAGVAQSRNRIYLSIFREKAAYEAYLALLEDSSSPLRLALRAYRQGVKDIIEQGITEMTQPHLFLSPSQICNRSWRNGEFASISCYNHHMAGMANTAPRPCLFTHSQSHSHIHSLSPVLVLVVVMGSMELKTSRSLMLIL